MNCSIVIVTYNGKLWIDRCLKSIQSDYEIIVVDNHSTDNMVGFIRKNYPEVTVLEQNRNLGFGQANNIGIKHALKKGADYVFLLNQDVYVQEDTISNLINVYESNKGYGLISPIHLNGVGTRLDRKFSNYLSYDKNEKFYFDAIFKQLFTIYEVPFVNAAAWLIPKSTLNKIGGFDPIFFHYGEDDNYCQRLRYHKLKIGIATNSYIYHDRETLVGNNVNEYLQDIKLKEKMYKINWADINKENLTEISARKKKLRISALKAILLLKTKSFKALREEIELICTIEKEVRKSKDINKTIGAHYI